MSVYFSICVSLSVGLILGAVGGGKKEADKRTIRRNKSQEISNSSVKRQVCSVCHPCSFAGAALVQLLSHTWHYGAKDGRICKQHVGVDCCCSERYFHHVCLCGIYQKKRVRVLLTACKERKKMCAATVGAGMHIGR